MIRVLHIVVLRIKQVVVLRIKQVLVTCLEECLALRVSDTPKYREWIWEVMIEFPHRVGFYAWSFALVELRH